MMEKKKKGKKKKIIFLYFPAKGQENIYECMSKPKNVWSQFKGWGEKGREGENCAP